MINYSVTYNNGAQPLRFVPIDRDGRPTRVSTCNYTIVDLRESEDSTERTVVASTAATLGSESTTLSAAAGPTTANPKRMTVAAVTSFVEGRTYLLSTVDGRRETFVLEGIDSTNKYLYARHELRGTYASSDTVQAIELVAEFPAAEANDEDDTVEDGGGPYQITWSYTIDSREYIVPGIVYVSRYSTQPWVTAGDVLDRWPTMAARARGRFSIEQAIASATKDVVSELESSGRDPDYFRLRPSGADAVCFRALWYMMLWCSTPEDDARAEHFDSEYKKLVQNWSIGSVETKTVAVDPASNERKRTVYEGGYFEIS